MRSRIHLAVLALAVAAGAPDAASAQQDSASRVRPQTVVPPEEPASGTRKRSEIESQVAGEDFSGQGVARGRDERDVVQGIELGQSVRGSPDRTDRRAEDDTYYEEWSYRGRPGTRVTVTMGSGAFDTFLLWGRMLDGDFVPLVVDDDGAEGSDSRLRAWVRDGETYVIRANSFDSRATGRYTLLVEEAPALPDPGLPKGDVAPGQTRTGSLGDGDALLARGTYYEVWRYRGEPGQRVTVTVSSDDFDTRIGWAQLVGAEPIALLVDDDGGEGTNSELTVQVEPGGEFAVVVSAMGPGQTGAYTLRVQPARR